MAKEEKEKKEGKKKEEKKGFNFKIILIGLPLFIVQLIIVYFVTANFILKRANVPLKNDSAQVVMSKTAGVSKKDKKYLEDSTPKFIYSLKDIIVNPAGTNGQRLLLVSIGLGVPDKEELTKLKEEDVVLRDVIISTLASKDLSELTDVSTRDSLKIELAKKIDNILPENKIQKVYFSKYVIN